MDFMFPSDWGGWLQLCSWHHEMPTEIYALAILTIKSVAFGTL